MASSPSWVTSGTIEIELVKFTAWLSQRNLRKARNFFACLIYGVSEICLLIEGGLKMHLACFVSFMTIHFFLNLDFNANICLSGL